MAIGGLATAALRNRRVRLPGLRLLRLTPYWRGVDRGGGRRSAARSVRAPPSRGQGERVLFPPQSSSDASATDVKPRRRLPCVISRYRVGLRLSGLVLDWLRMRGRPRRGSRARSGDAAPPPPPPLELPPPPEAKLIVAEERVEKLPLYRENDLQGRYMDWFDWPRPANALIGVCIPRVSLLVPFAAACDGQSVLVCEPDSIGFIHGLAKMKDRVVAWKRTLMEATYDCSPGFCLTQRFIDLNGGSLGDALEKLQVEQNRIRFVPQSPTNPRNDDEQISAFEAYRVFCVANRYFPLELRLSPTLSEQHLSAVP